MPHTLTRSRIVIVEDHDLFGEALEVALTLENHDVHRVPIADHALTQTHLLAEVLRLRPGLVLLDLDLGPAGDGACLLDPLTQAGIAVVIVTGSVKVARWGECVHLGAVTVLPKTTPLSSILATIRLVAEGRPVLAQEVRDSWELTYHREKSRGRAILNRLETLTSREQQVLASLMAGQQVRHIAERSNVSETTVRTQVKSILAKLDVSSQLAAVAAAYQVSWRPPVLHEHA
jgi:two-component system, NarL family, nitrate/nitrite response regulator NarL